MGVVVSLAGRVRLGLGLGWGGLWVGRRESSARRGRALRVGR